MPKRPPCPGDPEDYVWVESGETPHWRRRRGTLKKASLNSAYKNANKGTKIVAPAAKRVRNALAPYMRGLRPGRLQNRISSAFRKSLKEKGKLRLSCLKGIEMQRDYPLDSMLVCNYKVQVGEKSLRIEIPINWSSVQPFNNLVTDYYLEAVLLYGDVNLERGLNAESLESPLYQIHTQVESVCILALERPQEDWCLLLKLTSHEENEMAAHTKHYRMKVVAVDEERE